VLELLEHHHAGALAEHKAVAVLVEGPAGPGRVVVALRQGPGRDKAAQAHGRDAGLGAAGDHHVGLAPLDGPQGVADGVGRRGAGRGDGGVGAAQAEVDGDGAAGRVGDHLGDDERRDAAGPAVAEAVVLFLELGQPADTAAEDDAGAEGVHLAEVDTAVAHGLDGRHQGKLGEAVQPPRHPGVEDGLRLEVLDLPAKADLEPLGVDDGDGPDAALSVQQALPVRGDRRRQRVDRPHARDDDAAGHFLACSRSM
jgi:hypothetical protein